MTPSSHGVVGLERSRRQIIRVDMALCEIERYPGGIYPVQNFNDALKHSNPFIQAACMKESLRNHFPHKIHILRGCFAPKKNKKNAEMD